MDLSEDQYKKLGEFLSSAVHNRNMPHVSDLRRASVLIFNLIQKGYYFRDRELDNVMFLAGDNFSETARKDLYDITWGCNELVEGLNNSENERFKLKDFE
jgi:hypothetical protein